MSDILEKIKSNGLCHGCGGCVAAVADNKIEMAMSPAGFLRPYATQALDTADEEIVRQVCTGRQLERPSMSAGVDFDPVWGSIISVEKGYSTDPEIRYRGSSGGVISAVALHLLEMGIVDYILQTGVSPDDPVGSSSGPSVNRAQIIEAAGSRYAPSAPLANLQTYLAQGRRFAFIGKPCDVATLCRLARQNPRINELIPVKIAFFCAGVPSRSGALAVVKELGVAENELRAFSYRGRGWPGLSRATRRDGSEESMDYNSSWGRILSKHLQFRCKICAESTGEFADIACADAWYGKDGYPDFTEKDGWSLVIARTRAGRDLLDAMVSANKVVCKPVDWAEIAKMQPFQYTRKRGILARALAMRIRGFTPPHYIGFPLVGQSLRARPIWVLRNFLGTFRRLTSRLGDM